LSEPPPPISPLPGTSRPGGSVAFRLLILGFSFFFFLTLQAGHPLLPPVCSRLAQRLAMSFLLSTASFVPSSLRISSKAPLTEKIPLVTSFQFVALPSVAQPRENRALGGFFKTGEVAPSSWRLSLFLPFFHEADSPFHFPSSAFLTCGCLLSSSPEVPGVTSATPCWINNFPGLHVLCENTLT